MSKQTVIDTFRELNHYTGRQKDWPSDEVFTSPRRTMENGWKKFHAARDCGSDTVRFIEKTGTNVTAEKYAYNIHCSSCGYKIPEEEVLFIGGDWYREDGLFAYGRPLEDLHLPEHRVLSLGPQPSKDELLTALNLTRIEREATVFGLSFGNESYRDCQSCEHETFLTFDDKCRMCYDGEWTDSMQETLVVTERSIRERNNSFVHRLESNINPFSIHNRLFEDKILWRFTPHKDLPRLVTVTKCFEDLNTGENEYVLTDMHGTETWLLHGDEIRDVFWDTGLYTDDVDHGIDVDELQPALNYLGIKKQDT